jgi:hypothetical protein
MQAIELALDFQFFYEDFDVQSAWSLSSTEFSWMEYVTV